MTWKLGWLATAALATRLAAQREVWQADLQVQTLEVTSTRAGLVARVVVFSENRDAARNARVEILLPVGVAVLKVTDGCAASPPPSRPTAQHGRVVCQLGDLPVRALREVWVTTTTPPAGVLKTFGAVALSDTPDPRPGNNHAERTIP